MFLVSRFVFSSFLFWVLVCGEECYPYSLNNECDDFVSVVSFPPSVQQEIFDFELALPISDIRMLSPSCRRPLIQYLCQQTFSFCPNVEVDCSEAVCLFVKESCEEADIGVEVLCETNETERIGGEVDSFDEKGGELLSLQQKFDRIRRSRNFEICDVVVDEVKRRTEERAVKVVTCINANYTNITCCPDPFTRDFFPSDEDGECVVSCWQTVFGEDYEDNQLISNVSFLSLGILVFLFVMIPITQLTHSWRTFPTYLLPLAIWFSVLNYPFINLTIFKGGGKEVICDGKRDYLVAFDDYTQSSSCRAIGITSIYMINNILAMVLLVAFTSMCKILYILKDGDTTLKIFVDEPVPKPIQLSLVGILIIFNTICYLYSIIRFSKSEDISVLVIPVLQLCIPKEGTEHDLLKSPTVIYGCLIFLCFGVVLFFLLKMQLFGVVDSQVRSLFVSLYALIFSICVALVFFTTYIQDGYDKISDYYLCVSSYPQDDPPPCSRSYQSRDLIVLLCLLVSLWPFLVSMVVYFRRKVYQWWGFGKQTTKQASSSIQNSFVSSGN